MCRNAFVELRESLVFASISPGSPVPVPGLLVSGFQLEVLPRKRASHVSPGLMGFSVQLRRVYHYYYCCLVELSFPPCQTKTSFS